MRQQSNNMAQPLELIFSKTTCVNIYREDREFINMEVKDTEKNLLKYLTVIVFALFAVGALLVFGYYALHTVVDLIYMESVIEFNKGAMYMLGVGLSAGLLTSFMIYEIQNRKISESFNKKQRVLH